VGRLSISDYEWRFIGPERLFAMNMVTFQSQSRTCHGEAAFFTLVLMNHLPELSGDNWRRTLPEAFLCLSCHSPAPGFQCPRAELPISSRSLKQLDAHGHDMICNRDGAMSRSCRFWKQFAINNFLLRLFGRYYRQMWMAHKETQPY